MRGFPPAADEQVTLANWRRAPYNRWAFQHVRELIPTAEIASDPGGARNLTSRLVKMADLPIPNGDQPLDLKGYVDATDTDGIVVTHRGRLVYETYRNGMTSATPHILMSVSKSVLGLLVGILTEQGDIDPEARVTQYVPEAAGSAYADARLADLLDMRAGVKFDEDYLAKDGPIIDYRRATAWEPLSDGEKPSDLRSFLLSMGERDGSHGRPFHYISTNTDMLGWVIERATQQRYSDLLSSLLWQPMGARWSAHITVDRLGAPRAAGGICTSTRDLTRLGQLVAEGGGGIVPKWWIDDIQNGGDKEAWDDSPGVDKYPGLPVRYRSQWYVLDRPTPMLFAIGVYGQSMFIDRENQIVITKFSSQELPVDLERKMLTIRAAEAIRDFLAGND